MLHALRVLARAISAVALAAVLFTPSVYAQAIDPVRIAAVNLSYVAQSCKAGKAGLAQIEQLGKKKEAEAAMRAAELEQQRFELQQRGSVMSERARADLQKAFEKGRIDFQRFQEDAKSELAGMQRQFEAEFRLKLVPVVDQISKEKGLHFVFGLEQSTMIAWWHPSLDISDEIVKRLDAESKQ
jgi:Skp family chaperone for outer membrane proteins